MPPPRFNGQLQSYGQWVEKLQQWFGGGDRTYRKPNEARLILSTLAPWLKGIINTRVAKATQHTRTAPTLKELSDFMEHRFDEYDPSRADQGWQAPTPRQVKGQVSPIDSVEFNTRWQSLLPLSNASRPDVTQAQLLSKLAR